MHIMNGKVGETIPNLLNIANNIHLYQINTFIYYYNKVDPILLANLHL